MTIRLPAPLLAWIDSQAAELETGRSDMVRRLIEESRLEVPQGLSRIRTAYHEAGHAVMARALDIPIKRVTITPDNDDDSLGHIVVAEGPFATQHRWRSASPNIESDLGWQAHIMYLAAGRESEQMVLGFHYDTKGDRRDRADIKKLARGLETFEPAALVEVLRDRTFSALMLDLKLSVKRVAEALLRSETLDQRKVDRIMADTGERISSRFMPGAPGRPDHARQPRPSRKPARP